MTVRHPETIFARLMADAPDNTLTTDVARVRDVLSRELETITRYEALAAHAGSSEVRDFLLHLAQEEKEHVSEAVFMLRRLDPVLDQQFSKPFDATHFAAGAVAGRHEPPEPVPPPHPSPAPSVGPPAEEGSGDRQDLAIPADPRRTLYALPAPPSLSAGQFSVGSLKRRTP